MGSVTDDGSQCGEVVSYEDNELAVIGRGVQDVNQVQGRRVDDVNRSVTVKHHRANNRRAKRQTS